MNRDWMRQRLEDFKDLCVRYQTVNVGEVDSPILASLSDQMAPLMPTVREILKRLDPELAKQVKEPGYIDGAFYSLRAVQQGLGILRDQDEWNANLEPTRLPS